MENAAVIDASLAAMWVIPEEYSSSALALTEQWGRTNTHLIAPCLMMTEVTNALYKRVIRGETDLLTTLKALEIIMEFNIEIREEPGLHVRAMELSDRLKMTNTYDCHYLALAEMISCPFWTGDKKFYNAASKTFPQIKWIGHYKQER